jgi:hypothetical protein
MPFLVPLVLPSLPYGAPTTVPSNSPVLVKSWGELEASNTAGVHVEVDVSVPDAPLKRPVPPVILYVSVRWAAPAIKSMQRDPPVIMTVNRLPSWKRNTPPPATVRKKR